MEKKQNIVIQCSKEIRNLELADENKPDKQIYPHAHTSIR
jgi:hypothetical protein